MRDQTCLWCSDLVESVDAHGACHRCAVPVTYPVFCGWCEAQVGVSAIEHSTSICGQCLQHHYPEEAA